MRIALYATTKALALQLCLGCSEEFKQNKLDKCVTTRHCDVCKEGFGEALNGKANAVFLDLPSPWLAVQHAHDALQTNGRVCSYSPCIEQSQRTCEAMRECGFESKPHCNSNLTKLTI